MHDSPEADDERSRGYEIAEKPDTRGEKESERRSRAPTSRRRLLAATAGAIGFGLSSGVGTGAASWVTPVDADTKRTDMRDVMFTCNAKDGSVSLYDAQTLQTYRTISVYPDENPEDQVSDVIDQVEPAVLNSFARENYLEHANISPNGRTLYAARGHAGDVVAIDIETGEKRWETELEGVRADHQTISSDGRFLFTSDLVTDRVDKIETKTGSIIGRGLAQDLPHGNHYHDLPAFGGGATMINGSLGNMAAPDSQTGDPMRHRLTFIDPQTMTTLRTVDFKEGVRPFSITHDGQKAYVQLSYFHGFHEYDIADDRITRTKDLPKTEHVPESEGDYPLQSAHHGIDISGDGEYICVAGTTSWYAAIIRRSDLSLVDTIPVGEHPYWVQTGPDGERAFVPVRGENEVAVISFDGATEIGRVEVGAQPHVTEYAEVPAEIL